MWGVLFAALILGFLTSGNEKLECKATADTWIGMHRWESRSNPRAEALKHHGSEKELQIRGRISFALLRFDLSVARGLTVRKGSLRFYRSPDPAPPHTLGLSTISGNGHWREETANFFQPDEKELWSYPGSDLVDVTFGQGGSLYIEYLILLTQIEGWDRDAVTSATSEALDLSAEIELTSEEDAGQIRFQKITDQDMESLRRRVAQVLVEQSVNGYLRH
jgi:hypothetical protein